MELASQLFKLNYVLEYYRKNIQQIQTELDQLMKYYCIAIKQATENHKLQSQSFSPLTCVFSYPSIILHNSKSLFFFKVWKQMAEKNTE